MAKQRLDYSATILIVMLVWFPWVAEAQYEYRNVELLSHMPLNELPGIGDGTDIWGWTDPLTGGEYALVGGESGTAFVDITNPNNPQFRGTLPSTTGSSTWRDIKVNNNHAYIVSDNNGPHGVQIFDLTRLRDVNSPHTFTSDFVYDEVRSAHNIAINEQSGFAYVTDGRILDLADPLNPVEVGFVAGGTHDSHAVIYQDADTDYQGREILFSFNGGGVQIFDVEDKSDTFSVSTVNDESFSKNLARHF